MPSKLFTFQTRNQKFIQSLDLSRSYPAVRIKAASLIGGWLIRKYTDGQKENLNEKLKAGVK